MKNSKVLANQHIIRRYQKRSWYLLVILIFIAAWFLLQLFPKKIIYPCPDKCTHAGIQVVYAKDEAPELVQIISYITMKFMPYGKQVVKEALMISACEYGWRKEAVGHNTNGTFDSNLFQINSIHIAKYGNGFMTSWKTNVDVAEKIYKEQGWTPWSCKYVL